MSKGAVPASWPGLPLLSQSKQLLLVSENLAIGAKEDQDIHCECSLVFVLLQPCTQNHL